MGGTAQERASDVNGDMGWGRVFQQASCEYLGRESRLGATCRRKRAVSKSTAGITAWDGERGRENSLLILTPKGLPARS